MTINTGSAEPVPISGDARQAARDAKLRQRVVMLVGLATAARVAVDKRTLAGVTVLAIGLVAATHLTKERGTPGLDWYRRLGQDDSGSSA
jgi:hypothetical protein